MKMVLIVAAWIGISIINAGFINADFRGRFPALMSGPSRAKENLGFSIMWSLSGVAWFITPFVTGFYYYGWTLESGPVKNDH